MTDISALFPKPDNVSNNNKIHGKIPSKVRIFCEGSSVRGMQKITKAPTPFLKILWISFVFLMSISLLVSSGFIIRDFLQYDSAWHTGTEIDGKTVFPALTICSHNPFSMRANKIWSSENRTMKTPTEFKETLYKQAIKLMKNNSNIGGLFPLYDQIENYYYQLSPRESRQLGHPIEILFFCMLSTPGYSTISEFCGFENERITVREVSHNKYFNCYTIEKMFQNEFDVFTRMIVLIKLTPSEDIEEMKSNFIMDTMLQGEGVKLVIHEPFTYPDIDRKGINIQPGKMNELVYQPVRWSRYSSQKKPCVEKQRPIRDLEREYKYTFTQCLDLYIQNKLIDKCKCMVAYYPRPKIPSRDYPYCFNISMDSGATKEKYDCTSEVLTIEKKLKEEAQVSECLPRCNYMTYETQLSVTRWKPYFHKIKRLPKMFRAVNDYLTDDKNITLRDMYIKLIEEDQSFAKQEVKDKGIFDENRFTYVSLKRQNSDVTLKREKLVIDVYILFSRVGGLCSLCIGLTTAFFIELIEFIYLSLRVEKVRRNTMHNPSNHETLDLITQRKAEPVYLPTVDYGTNYSQIIRDNGVINDDEDLCAINSSQSEVKVRQKFARRNDHANRKVVDFEDDSYIAVNTNCASKCADSPWHRPSQNDTLEEEDSNVVPISSV